jgi:hypothetical protein
MRPGATQRARDLAAAQKAAEANAKAVDSDLARPEVQLAEARRQLDLVRAEVAKLPEYPRSPMFQEGDLGAELERIEFAGAEVRHLRAERLRLRILLGQADIVIRAHAPAAAVGASRVRAGIADELAAPPWQPELEGGS